MSIVHSSAAQPSAGPLVSKRPALLFLCHRIPYPPNKGDKIRSFHLLRYLSHRFDIHLGAFVDEADDWQWAAELEKYCVSVLLRPLTPWRAKLRSAEGLLRGQPLTVPYYADAEMTGWVERTVVEHEVQQAVVYSAAMGQFLPEKKLARTVIDFVDVDSDKWRQYADRKRFPMSWVYRREAKRLFEFEEQLTRQTDAALFVSAPEANLFRGFVPDLASKVSFYNNGVDTTYFDPRVSLSLADQAIEARESDLSLVFTGAMDYWPNVDAVVWFAHEVLPALQADNPGIRLLIVGGNPTREVLKLKELPGVEVTGRVPDVRPYLCSAVAAIAPMRIARGVQNKVLEAMAMAKPVLVSSKGLEGIDASHGQHVLVTDSLEQYRDNLRDVLAGGHAELGQRARALVCRDFSWEASLPKVVELLAAPASDSASR